MSWIAISSGLGVGITIGLTGVGGGSLMTPLLLTIFRLNPAVAIGTDLWFAAVTKTAGAVAHHRAGHVDWRVASQLLAGSVPGSVLTLLVMHSLLNGAGRSGSLTLLLGIALLLTATTVALRNKWLGLGLRMERWIPEHRRTSLTVLSGLLLGVLVSMSSIGAGAIGGALLMLLYPRLSSQRIVGTDIAHAMPLTLVAGVGHAALGNVDWALLPALLAGSIPGIWLGSQIVRKMPERSVRALLCLSLMVAGLRLAH